MKRLLPQPAMSLVLLLCWLLLNNTVHPAHWALGVMLAVAIPLFTQRIRMQGAGVSQWLTVVVLAIIVLIDIVKSNIEVAKLILGPASRIQPRFVWMPLDVTDAYAKAALAGIITMTPGTLSVDFSDDGKHLLIHALNVTDEAALIAGIKSRYEMPLKEIFE